ncbi:unnamed protein product [Protopolystoma xenopodis]|uniref:Uncharacterized protein n=1 Tax=Protopolystoma xenopodis TaxID=117903 RepID=A0A3S5FCL8_9PLAT|nr:unnamed protein product [Protopolystoma xenopodis]
MSCSADIRYVTEESSAKINRGRRVKKAKSSTSLDHIVKKACSGSRVPSAPSRGGLTDKGRKSAVAFSESNRGKKAGRIKKDKPKPSTSN